MNDQRGVEPDAPTRGEQIDVPWTDRSRFLYHLFGRLFQLILVTLYRCKWEGVDRVPREGPVLLVSNHQSYLDPPLIGSGLLNRRDLFYVARRTLFRNPVVGRVFVAVNAVPVDQDEADTGAIRTLIAELRNGNGVLIFPEGSRTFNGQMDEFKRGMSLLVKRAKCPVLPCAVEGVYDTWARTERFPKLRGCHVGVRFGEPIDYDELMRDGPDAALRRVEREVDDLRLQLRAHLRERTGGRFPPPGPGDEPSFDDQNA